MSSPAESCKKALSEATAHWPNRLKISDGIMGDPSHQARKSDHNDGNAFDLTHDGTSLGPDCNEWSREVLKDKRVKYVIWNRQIFESAKPKLGWQAYAGTNPHTKHMHVSILSGARDDLSPWPWAPGAAGKSRPQDNEHCFRGMGLKLWSARARGFEPVGEMRSGPRGSWWNLASDEDGYAVQNGGLSNPRKDRMHVGQYYFRFIGSIARNTKGVAAGMSGWWWIDCETMIAIRNYAERLDWPISRSAAHLLIIPKEWSDCAYLGRAMLLKRMYAFTGKGKPAAGTVSPDSALRRTSGTSVMIGAGHLEIKQYFVPGERDLIAEAFQPLSLDHVTAPGARLSF